ncbi:MAG: translation initiation factor IF-3 [Bacteroides sp.]|nr:translation initiation factor IF-3 [Bacteroides sp.]
MLSIGAKQPLINEEIHEKQVRVIGPDNEQMGIMSSEDALEKAIEADLDLVLIAPQGNPPVCRIMDYGKYRFEQAKKEKEARKNQKQSELKEVSMFLNIDVNDFNRKVSQAVKFLQNGDKVKVKVRFKRARELSHMNLGEDLMKRFMDAAAEYGSADKPSVLEGKNFTAVLIPKAAPSAKKSKPKQESKPEEKAE